MQRAVATKVSSLITTAVMAGLYGVALKRQFYANAFDDLSGITPDQFIMTMVFPLLVFGAVFTAGHFLIRELTFNARLSYSLLGLGALCVSTGVALPFEVYSEALDQGILSILVALTIGVGCLIGFIYVRSAGHVFDEDEVEQLEQAAKLKTFEEPHEAASEGEAAFATTRAVPAQPFNRNENASAVTATQNDEFFEGPLQVVTSWRAVFLATIAGSVVHTIYATAILSITAFGESSGKPRLAEQILSGEVLTSIAGGLILSLFLCLLILPPAIFGLHKYLGGKGRLDMGSYVKYGALAPLLLGLAFFIVGLFLTHWFIAPLAVAMGAYRHLAGLEPAALPEDIEVRDRRTLVGTNHIRRRAHRVVS